MIKDLDGTRLRHQGRIQAISRWNGSSRETKFVLHATGQLTHTLEKDELDIMFPTDNLDYVFPYFYNRYSAEGLHCHGDGLEAWEFNDPKQAIDRMTLTQSSATIVYPAYNTRSCPCSHLEHGEFPCKPIGRLMFMLLDAPVRIYQLDVSSKDNVTEILNSLHLCNDLFGRISRLPLKLKLDPAFFLPNQPANGANETDTFSEPRITLQLISSLTLREIVYTNNEKLSHKDLLPHDLPNMSNELPFHDLRPVEGLANQTILIDAKALMDKQGISPHQGPEISSPKEIIHSKTHDTLSEDNQRDRTCQDLEKLSIEELLDLIRAEGSISPEDLEQIMSTYNSNLLHKVLQSRILKNRQELEDQQKPFKERAIAIFKRLTLKPEDVRAIGDGLGRDWQRILHFAQEMERLSLSRERLHQFIRMRKGSVEAVLGQLEIMVPI